MAAKSHRAFTLVELLLATTVIAAIVILVAQVIGSVTAVSNRTVGNVERRQSGRALIDFIAQELRGAVLPLDTIGTTGSGGGSPGTEPSPNLQFVLNPGSVSAVNRNPSALFWQAPAVQNSEAGDLAEYGYFVTWEQGERPRATLRRLFLDSDHPDYLVYDRTNWITDAVLASAAPADKATGYLGLFAENVVGFWARCLAADGQDLRDAGGDVVAPSGTYDSRLAGKLPAAVEISIVQLDSRTATLLTEANQAALRDVVNRSVNGDDCVARLQANSALQAVARGAHAYATRVLLETAMPEPSQ